MKFTINNRRALRHVPVLCVVMACAGMTGTAAAYQVGGSATLTSDYVWRGSTQTQGDAAVQAGFKAATDNGFYASAWGSNVEFAPETHASSELDFTVGWSGKLADDWALDANVLHYHYPSTTVDLNWTELNSTVTWKDNYWLSLGWSSEALGTTQDGLYSLIGARLPVNEKLRLEAMAGYYSLQDVRGGGYAHGQVNAIWAFAAPLELRVSAHATDSKAKALFGEDYAGSRWEVALQGSF
ncbi:TorF family putative porin [Stenotrophomonas sp. SY1]|uniref:TorF family putative porin n=1 Tax=Stenotrophomonas sp. SY1 TaxID=477235 RepID=UPI001E4D0969|nr:TorF family putative porin [Stenotrophomonas sp. SY1]MCD9088429.1 TorF family putative porin [Stenotrophomonas sp. SY1]